MNTALVSISAITILMIVGLVFFIRASVKDRTEALSFALTEPVTEFLPKLESHLIGRSYRLVGVNEEVGAIYEGLVSPSWFMAIFLSCLAGVGGLCLGLILSLWVPVIGNDFLALGLVAPLAGVFYWRQSARPEQVKLTLAGDELRTVVTVTGHRDELKILEKSLAITALTDDA